MCGLKKETRHSSSGVLPQLSKKQCTCPLQNSRIFSTATSNNSLDSHRSTMSSRKPAKLFMDEPPHIISLRRWHPAAVIGHRLSHSDYISVKFALYDGENFLQKETKSNSTTEILHETTVERPCMNVCMYKNRLNMSGTIDWAYSFSLNGEY